MNKPHLSIKLSLGFYWCGFDSWESPAALFHHVTSYKSGCYHRALHWLDGFHAYFCLPPGQACHSGSALGRILLFVSGRQAAALCLGAMQRAGDKWLAESFLPVVLGKWSGEDYCCCWLLSLPLRPLGRGTNTSLVWKQAAGCWMSQLINKQKVTKETGTGLSKINA